MQYMCVTSGTDPTAVTGCLKALDAAAHTFPLQSYPKKPASWRTTCAPVRCCCCCTHHVVSILHQLCIHLQGCLHITFCHRLPHINDLQHSSTQTQLHELDAQANCHRPTTACTYMAREPVGMRATCAALWCVPAGFGSICCSCISTCRASRHHRSSTLNAISPLCCQVVGGGAAAAQCIITH